MRVKHHQTDSTDEVLPSFSCELRLLGELKDRPSVDGEAGAVGGHAKPLANFESCIGFKEPRKHLGIEVQIVIVQVVIVRIAVNA